MDKTIERLETLLESWNGSCDRRLETIRSLADSGMKAEIIAYQNGRYASLVESISELHSLLEVLKADDRDQ